ALGIEQLAGFFRVAARGAIEHLDILLAAAVVEQGGLRFADATKQPFHIRTQCLEPELPESVGMEDLGELDVIGLDLLAGRDTGHAQDVEVILLVEELELVVDLLFERDRLGSERAQLLRGQYDPSGRLGARPSWRNRPTAGRIRARANGRRN